MGNLFAIPVVDNYSFKTDQFCYRWQAFYAAQSTRKTIEHIRSQGVES